jgi:release factor glutamine methyltransferase
MSINIQEALQGASFCLRAAGLEQPRSEAEALLSACLGVSRAWLYAHGDEVISTAMLEKYNAWIKRRAAGEPYAYLAGEKEFMGLSFLVTPAVLIPRPETEILVEAVVAKLRKIENPRILEVGAGSGAIAVSLAVFLPQAEVTAVDISREALAVAAQNAARQNVSDRLRLLEGDLYAPVVGENFTAVVSNPPYIPAADLETLQRDVKDYEPRLALDGGPDGLDFYRRLTGELALLGAPPKLLAFEVGQHQADKVCILCHTAGYKKTRQINDLAGIPRTILAT